MLSMELKGNVNLFCHDHHQSSVTEMDIKDFPAISNLLIIDLYIDTTYLAFVFWTGLFWFLLAIFNDWTFINTYVAGELLSSHILYIALNN